MSETSPSPRPPIPVQSIPIPVPAGYMEGTWGRPHRPRIVTAIGVLSILLGLAGVITAAISALYGVGIYLAGPGTATLNPPVTSTLPTRIPATDEPIIMGRRGVTADQRQIMIDGLASFRPLKIARRKQLDALFALAGQDLFTGAADGLSTADIRRAVSEHGELPGTVRQTDNGETTTEGADYFAISTGRIEVLDDRALFIPTDRAAERIRVARKLAGAGGAETQAFAPLVPTTAPNVTVPFGQMTGSIAAGILTEGILSGLLAIYLLVIGILTLRQHRKSRGLHFIFAILKLPLALLCGVLWWKGISQMLLPNAMLSAATTSSLQSTRTVVIVWVSELALFYPVGLLVILWLPGVRRAFRSRDVQW